MLKADKERLEAEMKKMEFRFSCLESENFELRDNIETMQISGQANRDFKVG